MSACRRASMAVRTALPVGARSQRGPIGRPGGTDAHTDHPRVVAGRRGRVQRTAGAGAA